MFCMDYIQHKLYNTIRKIKRKQGVQDSTIVGYYNVLIQYQLYLMFACIWDKRAPELSREKRINYLKTMKKATLGTILKIITELDSISTPILGVNEQFNDKIMEFIAPRNRETAHGILVPGVQEDNYQQLSEKYEQIHKSIMELNIPILSNDCKIYYRPQNGSFQVIVFDNLDYDYQNLNAETVEMMDLQSGELHYLCDEKCYKISPFLILREIQNKEDPYEIYCYQEYNLKNSKFEYKRYNDLSDNISYSKICKDYFSSFQEEFTHTISKANGVICNKFENNYDYFISTSPIDNYEQKVWQFIKTGKSNACLTIRGGGGIGKTALVQYVSTKYIFEPFSMDKIQFVIFCSAKDREFKQISGLKGHIKIIHDESIVRCYEDIIRNISWVLDCENLLNNDEDIEMVENKLVNTSGVLLIVDDFETLGEIDKKKVVALSSRLDVSKHKMIITTRSQYMVGEEYYIESLDRTQTVDFMKERFKQGCTDEQYKDFCDFAQNNEIEEKLYHLTKGLPMLAIQISNILVLNGFKEQVLMKREDEEVEDFLLGRLYSYFGTKTSKVLFLIIANFFQFGAEEILHSDLEVVYSLLCKRINMVNIDYEQDLRELKKLNIILVENDYVRTSNYISSSVIRQCQDELMIKDDVSLKLFDSAMFKSIIELGIKDGMLEYSEKTDSNIDYAFVSTVVLENQIKYTNDVRFDFLEKYLTKLLDDIDSIRDLYRETCKYFEISLADNKFVYWSKKMGFIVPELAGKRDVHINKEEISTEYYIQEIITEFSEQLDEIDEFIIKRKKGASKSYCIETSQNIRGRLGSICNIKLARVLSFNLEGFNDKLRKIQEVMDEISYTPEFNMRDHEQYQHLTELLK